MDTIIDFLNDLLEYDRNAISLLIMTRVECNEELSNHPTVQVLVRDNKYLVGFLGILNGIYSKDNKYIAAIYDEDGIILKFKKL
jgi:hypothetical protein